MNDNYEDIDDRDDKLLAMASRLTTEVAPQRDLWPGIAKAIATPRRSRWTPAFAQAAAVLLLVGGSSGLTYLAVKDQGVGSIPTAQVVTTEMLFEQASFGGNYRLDSGFQDARGNLASKFDQELSRLSPESQAGVAASMKIVRDAIVEINAALEQDPGNALLQELLLDMYRDELKLMQRIGGLTNNVMKRNDI